MTALVALVSVIFDQGQGWFRRRLRARHSVRGVVCDSFSGLIVCASWMPPWLVGKERLGSGIELWFRAEICLGGLNDFLSG
jgi:hypothetical protein